ncbi:MAG TPA: hypothetical protein VNT99_19305 [Methylomirabilota bacterium]|nr:hypothetical protein [Methylomirabilota bacterium]
MSEQANTGEVQVPVFITGIITKNDGVDFCMDGANYKLHNYQGEVRLKARNPQAEKQLKKFAGRRIRVTVGGYWVWGPECSYVSVYYAEPATDVVKALTGKEQFA